MDIGTLAIITREHEVLLGLKRGNPKIGKNTLNGPGGHLEPGETIIDCLLRETWEEFGIILDPKKVEKCAVITFYACDVPDFEVHVFRTKSFKGKPHATSSMIPGWYSIENLPVDRMLESDQSWFPQLIRGEKFNASVYYLERAKGFLEIKFFPFTQ